MQQNNVKGEENIMKKKSRILLGMVAVFVMSTFLLQGCAIMEGETSRTLIISENKRELQVILKANQEENYEWQYFTENDNLNDMTERVKSNMFTNTFTKEYTFGMNDAKEDTLILVLYKTDDVENGKTYSYDVSYDQDGYIVVGDCKEATLKYSPELLEKVKNEMK